MSDTSRGRPRPAPQKRSFRQMAIWSVVPLASCAFVLGFGPVLASDRDEGRRIGDTSVFATTPFPGHPFGIAVDTDRVYVSTSRGDFFAQQANSAGERVFAFSKDGELLQTTSITTMPDAT